MEPSLPLGLSPLPYNQLQFLTLHFGQQPQECFDFRNVIRAKSMPASLARRVRKPVRRI
jgi:hypothetical protein